MTISPTVKVIAGVVAAVLIAFGARELVLAHDAATRADAVHEAQQQVYVDAQKQIDAAKKQYESAGADVAKAHASLQAQLAAIEAERKQPVTAPQFVVDLSKVIPNLPQPAVVVPAKAASSEKPAGSDDQAAAGGVLIPAADLQALQSYKLDCDAKGVQLSACQRVSADQVQQLDAQKRQLDAQQVQIGAVTKERDAEHAARKGGTWLQRLDKAAKCVAASGAGAAAGALLDKDHPARGSAIGAAAGGIGCQIVF